MILVLFLQTIAAVCMFLAGKVEETPRPLKDIILVSYEIIHKKDPAAVQRIKQKVCSLLLYSLSLILAILLLGLVPISREFGPFLFLEAYC